MKNSRASVRAVVAAVVALLLTSPTSVTQLSLHAAPSTLNQTTLSTKDPQGDGQGVFTIFYQALPLQVTIGTGLVIPVKLYVDNMTKLMSFLQDYNLTLTLTLSSGKTLSGKAGVSANQAAENLGALQLHAGQSWGPSNITMPLTEANTGLSQGQESVANATLRLDADVWFNQPINFFRSEANQTSIGSVVVADGTPAGPSPNYVGFGLLASGVIVLVVSLVVRWRRSSSAPAREETARKPPGAV